jgi:glycerol-3-phosphate acyltransferase PlsX
MSDDPARSLREKPGASITVAAKLVAEGTADGLVSAGSTGAAMAAAAIIIGRIKGVSRPAIASLFPTPGSPTLVLDSGANPDVKADQLAQFGIMGSVAAQVMLGLDAPRVGLLSNGEEKGKGRDLERAAYDLLESAPINFIGNVEGRDLATDRADVMVTDGFTGNIVVKTSEGAIQIVALYLLEELSALDPAVQEAAMPALAENTVLKMRSLNNNSISISFRQRFARKRKTGKPACPAMQHGQEQPLSKEPVRHVQTHLRRRQSRQP